MQPGAGEVCMEKEIVTVTTPTIACDGKDPPLGHPRVFLTFKLGSREIVCPYCSRHFVLAAGASATAAH
jgi:uncharacterized Zn-finger protein